MRWRRSCAQPKSNPIASTHLDVWVGIAALAGYALAAQVAHLRKTVLFVASRKLPGILLGDKLGA